jgi:hypothetical protein
MHYDETELRRRIQEAVADVFSRAGDCTTTMLVDELFVKMKPIVYEEKRAYTIAQLRELLTSIS